MRLAEYTCIPPIWCQHVKIFSSGQDGCFPVPSGQRTGPDCFSCVPAKWQFRVPSFGGVSECLMWGFRCLADWLQGMIGSYCLPLLIKHKMSMCTLQQDTLRCKSVIEFCDRVIRSCSCKITGANCSSNPSHTGSQRSCQAVERVWLGWSAWLCRLHRRFCKDSPKEFKSGSRVPRGFAVITYLRFRFPTEA